MYFPDYSLCIFCEKHGYTNGLRAPFHSTLLWSTCQSVPKASEISMRVLLSNYLVTIWDTDFEILPCQLILELLRLFVKILTTDDKYALCNIWNLRELIQTQLPRKLKVFSPFFSPFLKSASNRKNFEKKMALIPYVLPQLQTEKYMVRQMLKQPRFGELFDSKHAKVSQTLVKSP